MDNVEFKEIEDTLIELYMEYNQSDSSSDLKDRQLKAYHFSMIRDVIKFAKQYRKSFSNDEIHSKIIQDLTADASI
ncbi:hypothetical protein DDD_1746 [Nonlabens dokdonensis DSW-6]|uniref:Uncharacterized protein n=2 Tax=Nonlabens dokdonensis TaxID=328515 RepID=L7WDC0_NONDD|nr:hypothetical protein DDD_1746 [Nonlabens dokdonensis DSW-6]